MVFIRDIASLRLTFVFTLFPCQQVLASPASQVIQPDTGPLSLFELVQKTFHRIVEVGFLRGILTWLLILGCLVCLLIGVLNGLAAYLRRHDPKLWEQHDEINTFEGEKDEEEEPASSSVGKRLNRPDTEHTDKLQSQCQSRISRYLASNPSIPITKISIRASPRRPPTTTCALSAPSWSSPRTPTRTPVTPLRSALSKSPASSRQSSRVRTLVLESTSVSTGRTGYPSPKSVHWADEIQGHTGPQIEIDIGSRRVDGHSFNTVDALDAFSLPTYYSNPTSQTHDRTSSFTKTLITVQDVEHPSDRVTLMKLDGDTS
ncbi:uncharacterized protein Z519_12677 [Cladophialophora bantiana CBS 173.52]|uniref:SUN domain-containing protein n=1 Tax=Cladophialophora bantiana (strain ATCC 10958 / CBS 173.52 / CDC B-1940 / NIH 8579) TaxID=1442370 RepID=A0A0D2E986_CLAB1|nr:uncharacterized protein Z519_12677 [Cladophialophora bantiana CBS 173.52]KIW86691.1 hypothetical protein Z519_12677 [Cladophialophora bantiana CBS 173.52]